MWPTSTNVAATSAQATASARGARVGQQTSAAGGSARRHDDAELLGRLP